MNSISNKIYLLAFFFFLNASLYPQSSGIKDLEKVSIQLKWHHQFQFAGYYVAKYKGYYQEEGLDVTIIEGGPNASDENIYSGKYNFGVGDSRILLARMQEKPVVALAAIFQHAPDVIITRADRKIRVPSNFIGKKIMLAENTIPPPLQSVFFKEGISLYSFTTIPNEHDIESVVSGKVDGLIGYITNEPYQIRKKGVKVDILYPNDYGVDFYGDILFTSDEEIKNNRERVKAFLRASLKGWQYAMDNIPETADLILTNPDIKRSERITKDYLLYEGKTLEDIILSNVIPIGHINFDRMKRIAQTFQELKLHNGNYSLDGFIFEPNPKVDSRWKKYLVIGILTIFPVIVLSTILIIILRKLVRIKTHELMSSKKRLEELNYELEKSERKYKDLIENSKDIIFSLDGDGRIITINRAVSDILKYRVKDLIGKNFAELVYNSDTESHIELYEEIFKYTIHEVVYTKGSVSFNSDLMNRIGEPLEISINLQYVQMDKNYIILGTASLLKEDDILKFCEEEKQTYKIGNYLTRVDQICYRLSNGALKYSDQDTVLNIRICLREILINAIEHGNLEIDFEEKTHQQANGDYLQFLIGRQKEPKYANRFVTVEYSVNSEVITFRVTDEGNGFDHKKMLKRKNSDIEIQDLAHGRGIMIASDFFDTIEYNEKGNSVYLAKYFKKEANKVS